MKNTAISITFAIALTSCGSLRYTDTAPSGSSLDTPATLEIAELDHFAIEWLGAKSKRVPPRNGAAEEFQVVAQPPARPGYRSVGGREVDDAVEVFRQWCKSQGRKPVYSYEFPAANVPGDALITCIVSGKLLGALGAKKDQDTAKSAVTVSIFFYTPKSLSIAAGEAARKVAAEKQAQQRNLEIAAAVQRDIDIAHRNHLRVGDYASWAGTVGRNRINGVVVEIRPPLAYMQFPELQPNSMIWVRIDELGAPR